MLDVWLDGQNLGVGLSHNRGDLISPPLLEIGVIISRLPRRTIASVKSRDAGRIVAVLVIDKSDIIPMDAVDVEVIDQIHRHIDSVISGLGVAGVKRIIYVFGANIIACRPVVVRVGGAAVCCVDRIAPGVERDDPAVHLNALFAAGRIVGCVDYRLQCVEVGRAENPLEVRLAKTRRIANISMSAHLNKNSIEIRVANVALAGTIAYDPEQLINLRLVEKPGVPAIDPPASQLIGRRRSDNRNSQNKRQQCNVYKYLRVDSVQLYCLLTPSDKPTRLSLLKLRLPSIFASVNQPIYLFG